MALLIFDLDGTLIDSRLDLAHAVNATRRQMGREPLPHESIYSYVGNGAPMLIRRAMGPETPETDLETALDFFLAYYRDHALDFTTLYPGVRESIDLLHSAGVRMAVLTNKPVRISRHIMQELGLAVQMFRIYGGNSFEHKKPHPIGIDTLRAEADAPPEVTWMVGDSAVDVQTARAAGVSCCGVTYGFQPETFRDHPPDLLVESFGDFAGRFL